MPTTWWFWRKGTVARWMQDSRPYQKPSDPQRCKSRPQARPGWSINHRRSHEAWSISGRWNTPGRLSLRPSCHTESHDTPPLGAATHASTRIDRCRIHDPTPQSLRQCQLRVHCAHPEASELHKTSWYSLGPPPPPKIANCLARGLNEILVYKQTTILLQIFPGSKSWNPAAAPDLRQDITQTSSSTFPHTTHVISSSFFRNCTLPLLSHFLQKL